MVNKTKRIAKTNRAISLNHLHQNVNEDLAVTNSECAKLKKHVPSFKMCNVYFQSCSYFVLDKLFNGEVAVSDYLSFFLKSNNLA